MYIEFTYPTMPGITEFGRRAVEQDLALWSKIHNCKTTVEHCGVRTFVTLEKPSEYSMFALTWQGYKFNSIQEGTPVYTAP